MIEIQPALGYDSAKNGLPMRHIVYCWELGEGLGHMMALTKIVQQLIAQGNHVTCILKDLTHASRMLKPLGATWLAAPRMWSSNKFITPYNHADILHNTGYGSVESVVALLVAWRTALAVLKPDRVVCEYAPTALLAAKSLDLDVVCIDSGFSMPPLSASLQNPMVPIRPGATTAELLGAEARTLSIVNHALAETGLPSIPAFSGLFREKVWYRNWCEFNHFAPHSPERHLGQVFGDSGGIKPMWPEGHGKKLFAYLKPQHPRSVEVLKTAISRGYRVLAYLPGFAKDVVSDLMTSGRLAASPLPYRLAELPDDVEVGIWHSPTGAVARCLDSGMRMIFLPMHPEQLLASYAIRRAGLPAYVSTCAEDWSDVLESVAALPRPGRDRRWQAADVSDFASKLAGL